jgi:two-component system response regulator AtoC
VAIGDERIALHALRSAMHQPARKDVVSSGPAVSLKDAGRAASRRAERELILQVLARTRWNRKRAAEELRISYKALLYKLKQIGVDEDGATPQESL